jgi:hypothetical protein
MDVFDSVRPIMIPGFLTSRKDITSTIHLEEFSPKITRPGVKNVKSGSLIKIPFLTAFSASGDLKASSFDVSICPERLQHNRKKLQGKCPREDKTFFRNTRHRDTTFPFCLKKRNHVKYSQITEKGGPIHGKDCRTVPERGLEI